MEQLIVVYVAPGQDPEIRRVDDAAQAVGDLLGCEPSRLQFFLVPGGTAMWHHGVQSGEPNMYVAGTVFTGPIVITNIEPYGDGDLMAHTLGDDQAKDIARNLKGRKFGKGKV